LLSLLQSLLLHLGAEKGSRDSHSQQDTVAAKRAKSCMKAIIDMITAHPH
jgi:hypothetical protein